MKKIFFVLIALVFASWANQSDENKTQLTGYVSYQGGHVFSGSYAYENDIQKYWLQKIYANIGLFKQVNDWLSINASVESTYRSSFKMGSTFLESEFYVPQFYIDQARGDIQFINSDKTKLRLTTGYFHFKYNKDVTNLGNTLFKSYCYPTAIMPNEFDFPLSRLAGLDLYFSALNNKFFADVLYTTSLHMYPLGDFSLTAILGTEPFRGVTLKAGVQLDRFLSVSEGTTTPPDAIVNEEQFTYAGNKLMACLNLDAKKIIFGEEYPSIFGEEDLKFWIEGNILGLKDYKTYYDTLKQRIPVAFGVKFPTFKLLNVLAFEMEYFGSVYPNSIERPINSNKPYPEFQAANWKAEEWVKDNWKWSLYAKKDISSISIIAQAARDHLQLWSLRAVDQVFRDNLVDPENWYYQFKIQYRF